MTLEIRCDCCQRVNPPGIRAVNKFLMGDWVDHICFACFERWYDYGETDPAVIRAAVLAKAEPARDAARAEVERLKAESAEKGRWSAHWHGEMLEREADLARVRAALDRIIGMSAIPPTCACGRPNGLGAIRMCAQNALAEPMPPQEEPR